jgi:hypothetical protein
MRRLIATLLTLCLFHIACATCPGKKPVKQAGSMRSVHFFTPDKEDLPLFNRAVTEVLAPMGINTVIVEVNYGFAYQSHPELNRSGAGAIDMADARAMAEVCKANGIKLIPLFNCLGHQSFSDSTAPLLKVYPQFDETPWVPANNDKIYCRSWCPLHPDVNKCVFDLIDELIDAFQAEAVHVGMDEVFLIADSKCPRCAGKDPAKLFAQAVNDLHGHLVQERHVGMLMWSDRLLDQAAMGYNMWESSRNGTYPAIDMIPKDILLCDWHYGKRPSYKSVNFFQEKGFRVLPASWNKPDAALALLNYGRENNTGNVAGHLCTTWSSTHDFLRLLLGEVDAASVDKDLAGSTEALRACMTELKR